MRIVPTVRVLRAALVAVAVAWALLLPLAAYAASLPHASSIVYVFAAAVYAIGSLVCHQLPARSFHAWAVQMPVCARCTGIYAGAAIAAIANISRYVGRRFSSASGYRTALLLSVIPTLATLVYEWTSGQMPGHWIRAAAGVPLGAVAAAVVVAAADNQVN